MALTPGTRLGPYDVIAQIGVGGMGEVYRATDTKLKRQVALKILPAAVSTDPERLARLQREAEVLASLNHPHIAAIYGLEESGGVTALVMELVEGDDLSQRIARGALPIDEALPIATQMANALEAAHEQGIVHRDLKPANIKVTPDGVVKVLDFGLAKLQAPPGPSGVSQAPTITSPALLTGAGVLLGTAAYMSPEQAKGREADKRSDVWAFGAVLFEMLTGRRAFDGEDLADVLGAVTRLEPRWEALPPTVPPPIQTLLRQCLVKDRRGRIADIAAARFVLDHQTGAAAAGPAASAPPPARSVVRRFAIPATIFVTAATTAAAMVFFIPRPTPQPVIRLTVATSGVAAVGVDLNDRSFAVAPDGSRVVYTGSITPVYEGANNRLFVRALDQLEPTLLAGPGPLREPFFSPDSQWIAYFEGDRIQKVPAVGGPPLPVATIAGNERGATWGPDEAIIYTTNEPTTGLLQITANGGEPKVLTRPNRENGERDHYWPHFLPGGQAVLFTIVSGGPIEEAQIAVLDLRDGSQKVLVSGGSDARYVEGGYLVYGSLGTLRAVAFDVDRLEVSGTPVTVLQQVMTTSSDGAANFGVAATGTLTYVSGDVTSPGGGAARSLVWVDRAGREEPLNVPPRDYRLAQLSPDGTRVALDARDQQYDIWTWDLARKTLQRLTFDPGPNSNPVWAPDGKRVVFNQRAGSAQELYWQSADGSGKAEALTKDSKQGVEASDFLPDASGVLYEQNTGPRDIWMVRVAEPRPTAGTPILASAANERSGTVSPDGRWLAYQSDESGDYEIYVRPFPAVDTGRWQISTAGGTRPRWSRDGRELFYIVAGAPLAVMGVSVTAGSSFAAGSPVTIIEGDYVAPNNTGLTYDVSLDGKRFLMLKNAEVESSNDPDATRPQIVVVQNWIEELKRLVPTR